MGSRALLGFNVYRSGHKVNRALIVARAAGTARGADYSLIDRAGRGGDSYRLAGIGADGEPARIERSVIARP